MRCVPTFQFKKEQGSRHRGSGTDNIDLQVLGGIADTTAQTLTAINRRHRQKAIDHGKDDFFAVEIHELDKKVPWPDEEDMLPPSKRRAPPPFDFERLVRFMAYGFMMAPLQHKWFGFLHRTFPIGDGHGTLNAMKRVAFDQFLFAPAGEFTRVRQ